MSEGGASRLRSPFTKHCEATAALSTGPAPQEPGPILACQTKAPPPPRSGPAPRPTPGKRGSGPGEVALGAAVPGPLSLPATRVHAGARERLDRW